MSTARRRVLQPLAHLGQQLVARGVPERVVDRLEVVEVHEQDRGVLVVARLAVECVLDAVAEQRAVGEPGDGVVERLVGELLLELLALADVAHVEHDAGHVRVVHQVRAQRLDGDRRAVAVAQAELHQPGVADRRARGVREEAEHARAVVGVDEVDEPACPRRRPGLNPGTRSTEGLT